MKLSVGYGGSGRPIPQNKKAHGFHRERFLPSRWGKEIVQIPYSLRSKNASICLCSLFSVYYMMMFVYVVIAKVRKLSQFIILSVIFVVSNCGNGIATISWTLFVYCK